MENVKVHARMRTMVVTGGGNEGGTKERVMMVRWMDRRLFGGGGAK